MPIVTTFLCSLTFFLGIGPGPLLLYRMGRGECGSALESVNFPRVITVIWTQDLAAEKKRVGFRGFPPSSWLYERASISPTKTIGRKKNLLDLFCGYYTTGVLRTVTKKGKGKGGSQICIFGFRAHHTTVSPFFGAVARK